MPSKFHGGLHLQPHKEPAAKKRIEALPPPDELILPLSMHIGVPCRPLVQKGDRVFMGQLIGDSDAFISAPVHASVSGTVKEIAPRPHPLGVQCLSVVIANDHQDSPALMEPMADWAQADPETLIARIRAAGIVGHGGAAFPTHVKLRSALGKADTILLNGAECEPYLSSDHRVMLEHADEILDGARILLHILPGARLVIALENNKPDAVSLLRRLTRDDDRISLAVLPALYPQGSEKQLIETVTGREVPPGKLPADAGCVLFNVDTAAAIHRAVIQGLPDIRRVVTVAGSAITAPRNLEVRVGTPLSALIAAAGGFSEPPQKLIMGGPMMGVAQFSLDVPVLKGTNGVLAFSENEDRRVKNPVCIRCGRCVAVCPVRLLPNYLYQYAQKERYERCEALHLDDCIECGACAYECPASLHLTQQFRLAKARVHERRQR